MTDLGKAGSPWARQAGPCSGGSAATLPQPSGASQKAFFSGPPRGSSLLSCCLSLSDEQEDESMETTGKVEPV